LDQPAEAVYVRYVGDPALNNYQVYAHCLDDGRPSAVPVEITHRWTEGSEARSKSVQVRGPGTYEVFTEGDPVDESITISVPSAAK
jgi:outer membrane protein assembly factor BamB